MRGMSSVLDAIFEKHDFEKHGVVCLRGYFNNWVDVLREGIEKLICNPSSRERSYVPEDGSAPFFQDFEGPEPRYNVFIPGYNLV